MRFVPLFLILFVACGDPPVDDGDGGTAPTATGVLEGTILYAGPRPVCVDEGEGRRVVGRVVLTLFEYDNPPPPVGRATSAANLFTLPGPLLFTSLDDCLPDDPTLEDRRLFITRSVDFTWPELELHEDEPIEYQVRGFYDYDEDFNPFFSVSNLPTAGDVGGGAFEDTSAAVLVPARLQFGSRIDRPNGDLLGGVTVTLGAPVNTERPVFRMETLPLNGESTLPLTFDPVELETMVWEATMTRFHLYDRNPADPMTAQLLQGLEAGGLNLDVSNPFSYAWYIRPVDGDGDGAGDLHPLLGSLGIPWETPAPVMLRIPDRPDIEAAARIPAVSLVPSVRPSQTATTRVFYPSIDIMIPPIATMTTNLDPRCTIPMVPPGNTTTTYEIVTSDCQEVPAGRYATNVLHGVAAGLPVGAGLVSCGGDEDCTDGLTSCESNVCVVTPPASQTTASLLGGQFSSQAWTLPNDLGDTAQIGEENVVAEQGLASLFVVFDPDSSTPNTERAGCDTAIDPMMMAPRPIMYRNFSEHADADAVRTLCCAPIQHLCDVPLCGTAPANPADPTGPEVRLGPTELAEDGITPNCVPFLMPAACCSG